MSPSLAGALAEEIIAAKSLLVVVKEERTRTRTPSFGFGSTFLNESCPLLEVLSDLHFHTHLFTFYNPTNEPKSNEMFPHIYHDRIGVKLWICLP